MSHEIIYDRRFIKVNEDSFIPIVQHGSSNVTDYNFFTRREIAQKNWFNLSDFKENGKWKKKLYYSKKELEELAEQQDHCEYYKNKNKKFEPGKFKKWLLSGVKNAMTIEEYLSYGINTIAYITTDTKTGQNYIYEETHITSNEQIEPSIKYLKDKIQKRGINADELNISIRFHGRDCMKLLKKKNKKKHPPEKVDYYFTLFNPANRYYYEKKLHKRDCLTSFTEYAKKFKTEKEAHKFLEKNKLNQKQETWTVKLIADEAYI